MIAFLAIGAACLAWVGSVVWDVVGNIVRAANWYAIERERKDDEVRAFNRAAAYRREHIAERADAAANPTQPQLG